MAPYRGNKPRQGLSIPEDYDLQGTTSHHVALYGPPIVRTLVPKEPAAFRARGRGGRGGQQGRGGASLYVPIPGTRGKRGTPTFGGRGGARPPTGPKSDRTANEYGDGYSPVSPTEPVGFNSQLGSASWAPRSPDPSARPKSPPQDKPENGTVTGSGSGSGVATSPFAGEGSSSTDSQKAAFESYLRSNVPVNLSTTPPPFEPLSPAVIPIRKSMESPQQAPLAARTNTDPLRKAAIARELQSPSPIRFTFPEASTKKLPSQISPLPSPIRMGFQPNTGPVKLKSDMKASPTPEHRKSSLDIVGPEADQKPISQDMEDLKINVKKEIMEVEDMKIPQPRKQIQQPRDQLDGCLAIKTDDTPLACWSNNYDVKKAARAAFKNEKRLLLKSEGKVIQKVTWRSDGVAFDWTKRGVKDTPIVKEATPPPQKKRKRGDLDVDPHPGSRTPSEASPTPVPVPSRNISFSTDRTPTSEKTLSFKPSKPLAKRANKPKGGNTIAPTLAPPAEIKSTSTQPGISPAKVNTINGSATPTTAAQLINRVSNPTPTLSKSLPPKPASAKPSSTAGTNQETQSKSTMRASVSTPVMSNRQPSKVSASKPVSAALPEKPKPPESIVPATATASAPPVIPLPNLTPASTQPAVEAPPKDMSLPAPPVPPAPVLASAPIPVPAPAPAPAPKPPLALASAPAPEPSPVPIVVPAPAPALEPVATPSPSPASAVVPAFAPAPAPASAPAPAPTLAPASVAAPAPAPVATSSLAFAPVAAPVPTISTASTTAPAPVPSPSIPPKTSPALEMLEAKIAECFNAIDNWTMIMENYPARSDTLGRQVKRTEGEIFTLHRAIEEEKRRLAGGPAY